MGCLSGTPTRRTKEILAVSGTLRYVPLAQALVARAVWIYVRLNNEAYSLSLLLSARFHDILAGGYPTTPPSLLHALEARQSGGISIRSGTLLIRHVRDRPSVGRHDTAKSNMIGYLSQLVSSADMGAELKGLIGWWPAMPICISAFATDKCPIPKRGLQISVRVKGIPHALAIVGEQVLTYL